MEYLSFFIIFFIDILYIGSYYEPKVTQMPSYSLKHVVFKGVQLLGPRPKQQWPLPSALTPAGS